MNNILRRGHQNLQQFDERSRALVGNSHVVHFDETGIRVGKQLHWIHVASPCRNRARAPSPNAAIARGFLARQAYREQHWAECSPYNAASVVMIGIALLRLPGERHKAVIEET